MKSSHRPWRFVCLGTASTCALLSATASAAAPRSGRTTGSNSSSSSNISSSAIITIGAAHALGHHCNFRNGGAVVEALHQHPSSGARLPRDARRPLPHNHPRGRGQQNFVGFGNRPQARQAIRVLACFRASAARSPARLLRWRCRRRGLWRILVVVVDCSSSSSNRSGCGGLFLGLFEFGGDYPEPPAAPHSKFAGSTPFPVPVGSDYQKVSFVAAPLLPFPGTSGHYHELFVIEEKQIVRIEKKNA